MTSIVGCFATLYVWHQTIGLRLNSPKPQVVMDRPRCTLTAAGHPEVVRLVLLVYEALAMARAGRGGDERVVSPSSAVGLAASGGST